MIRASKPRREIGQISDVEREAAMGQGDDAAQRAWAAA